MFSSTIITIVPSTLLPYSAARRPLDLDKPTRHKSNSPGRYDAYAPESSHRDYSPDYISTEPKRSRYPKQDSAAPHSHSRYPEQYLMAEGGRSRHADPYPEHLLPSRGKHGDKYPDYEPTQTGRGRYPREEDTERVVRRKERPARPPPPQYPIERDKARDRERDKHHERDRGRDEEWDRHMGKDHRRGREQDLKYARAEGRDRERSRERGLSAERRRERERQKDKDRKRARSRDRGLEEDFLDPGHSRSIPRESRASWEEEDDGERERRARGRERVHSDPRDVFDEVERREDLEEFMVSRKGEGPGRERSHSHLNGETGTTLSAPLGTARVFVWCAGVAFCWGNLRWWVDLIRQSLMTTSILSIFMRITMISFLTTDVI